MPDLRVTNRVDSIHGAPIVVDAGVRVGTTQPRHTTFVHGIARIHGAISAVGIDGIRSNLAWPGTQG